MNMNIELITYTPNPELNISHCAAVCYDSEPKEIDSARKMIKALIRSGHTSTLEHSSVTFKLSGISRVVTHELVRHRIASYSQRSQRYVNECQPQYVIPDEIAANESAKRIYVEAMNIAWDAYSKLQTLGFKNEIARYVLPNATDTTICVTMNFRAMRNFLQLRCSKRAQPEIRKMAYMMLDKLIEIAPSVFEDLKVEENLQNT
jgi:thymidylate synthase (FAD)